MSGKLRLAVVASLLFAACLAHAAFSPITVYPNPIQFGTVAENSTGYVAVYFTNSIANSVTITGMTLSGGNSSSFTIASACVVTLSPGQTCETEMTFTPNAVTSFATNLLVSVQGLIQPITIAVSGTAGNPLPNLISISPQTVYQNSGSFTLTATGTGFISGSAIDFDGTLLPTTFVSSTQLTTIVPASYLIGTGSTYVSVENPPPGGGYSQALELDIVALTPSLAYASPNTVIAKTAPAPIILQGNNFMTGAKVLWNGKSQPTTYVNSGEVQFQPTTGELASAGIIQLSISNPPPGGLSAPIFFDVTYPVKVTVLDLPANGLVWDPFAQRIYASLPSSYGSQGNTVAVINPTLGRVSGYYFAGSEPGQLALSSDSKYLYVGLNGNGSVQRLVLPNFTADIDISLGTNGYGSSNDAISMQVLPSDPHTIAVVEGTTGCCGITGLYFFKDSTQLPDSITYPYIGDIVFANSTTLYGYYQDTVSQVSVNSLGGTLGSQWSNLLEGSTIAYASGLLYDNIGHVFNPTTGLSTGSFDIVGGCCNSNSQVLPDSAINRLFALGVTPFSENFLGVTTYNLSKFTPTAVANLSQVPAGTISSFISWGNNGLAFLDQVECCGTTSSQVVLLSSSSMFATGTQNPVPVAQSLSPSSATHGTWNMPVTITGTGFVPGSQVTWNGTSLYANYLSPTQLTLYVPASALASAGTVNVVVTNPVPGGGKSTPVTFTIN
ncbi:MAG TPA: hypothetical protein VMH04_13395 [Candidatus Solibacter sp.]|nr:hypothetical protein [Candidatus Solibacter sp.]